MTMAPLRRIWILFIARNREFLRDRSSLAWNILFPVLVIIGFGLLFDANGQDRYKVGLIGPPGGAVSERLGKARYLSIIPFESERAAMAKLLHHRIDLLVDPARGVYWTSSTSPRSYVAERIALGAPDPRDSVLRREVVAGREVPYIEWLFPGILGMNMMFSALFGVGYVVVRYRKNGVLKRMSVTPLSPWEFLTAQIVSRMFLILLTTSIVFAGVALMKGFAVRGSPLSLALVFALGGFSMIALALLIAARSGSEEFAGGVLNIISWPMMFLSEVWFSLEGALSWVQSAALLFPLTHMIRAARMIMNDGAGLFDVRWHLAALALMSLVFLAAGSLLFKWQKT